jgi:hypothetical protein
LSPVCGCLFNLLAATLHSWRAVFSICKLWMCHAVVSRDPHNMGSKQYNCWKYEAHPVSKVPWCRLQK